jgi:hypothetical protein
VENFFGQSIKSVQTDGGGEFIPVQKLLISHGISYRQTCPHTHHQNGSVERKLRHIVDTGLALLAHSHVPLKFWDDAFDTACYLINRLPSINSVKSPFELLFHKSPDFKLLKVFGCECWPYLRPYNSHKLSFRSLSCVFLGYSKPHVGYKCLHIPTGRIYVARHVTFNETMFPFQVSSMPTPSMSPTSTILPTNLRVQPVFPHSSFHQPTLSPSPPLMTSPPLELSPTLSPPHSSMSSPPPLVSSNNTINTPAHNRLSTTNSSPTPLSPNPPSPASSPPVEPPPRTHLMVTRAQNNIHQPKRYTDGSVKYPLPRAYTASLVCNEIEPTSYTQAAKDVKWRAAMAEEFNALIKTGTWTLVPKTSSMNVVGAKWVFRIKRKADGCIERYKARLVAKGFHQREGVDFFETYSPVVKPITVRAMLSLAVSAGWDIKQVDVSNAFLHGHLQETVYMSQPPGFVHPMYPDAVCLLKKALYGLKQAPRAWYHRFSSRLLELGFYGSKSDNSLFIYKSDSITIFALVYVDDIILTGSHTSAINELIHTLSRDFPMKDLGDLHYFLGVSVTRVTNGLHLSQSRYISDILTRTKMSTAKPISSPMAANSSLSKFSGSSFGDITLYRSTVGALQYLSLTRPDIAFAVSKVSQFMHDPRDIHWSAVKRILRYLKFTIDHGLLIRKCSSTQLFAYSDADWAGCPDDRKSTSGYCVFLGSNILSWSSKKQPTVSRSSTEAEYKAVANAAAELLWIQALFRDLGVFLQQAPVLFCDNIGATYLTSNPAYHARTKHIEIDYHFVRDRVASKTLVVKFLSSKDQLADALTKPLASHRFHQLKSNLNVCSPTLRLRGCNETN